MRTPSATSPTVSRSPSSSDADSETRLPLTNVPTRLPRSSTRTRRPSRTSRQCLRDTVGWFRNRLVDSPRPIVNSVHSGGSTRTSRSPSSPGTRGVTARFTRGLCANRGRSGSPNRTGSPCYAPAPALQRGLAMRLSDLRFRTRFLILGGVTLLGFATLLYVREKVLGPTRVGGPIYEGIARRQDLLASISSPRYSLLEEHLLACQAALVTTTDQRERLLKQMEARRATYEESHKEWTRRLVDPQLKDFLLGQAAAKADAYHRLLDGDGMKALRPGGKEAADF